MTLIRRNENYPAWSNFFNEFFNNDWASNNHASVNATLPSVNIKENTDLFEVEMAVPGMKKEYFKVELNNNYLTISAEKKNETENKADERYTRKEFSYSSFTRSFSLPELVENDKIEAKYEDGILKIAIPKREEAKPKPIRLIDIV